VKILFSNHAKLKIKIFKEHGFLITEEQVRDVVKNPDTIERGRKERVIAQKAIDDKHVLRVVYEISIEAIEIITFYPGRRSRYED